MDRASSTKETADFGAIQQRLVLDFHLVFTLSNSGSSRDAGR
jgi:hypothetical protein